MGKREQLRPMTVDWHWGPGSPVFSAYDTFDAVLSIGTVTDSGRCYRCGGRRSVPACKCEPGEHGGAGPGKPGPAQRVADPGRDAGRAGVHVTRERGPAFAVGGRRRAVVSVGDSPP